MADYPRQGHRRKECDSFPHLSVRGQPLPDTRTCHRGENTHRARKIDLFSFRPHTHVLAEQGGGDLFASWTIYQHFIFQVFVVQRLRPREAEIRGLGGHTLVTETDIICTYLYPDSSSSTYRRRPAKGALCRPVLVKNTGLFLFRQGCSGTSSPCLRTRMTGGTCGIENRTEDRFRRHSYALVQKTYRGILRWHKCGAVRTTRGVLVYRAERLG